MVTENEIVAEQAWDDEALSEQAPTDSKYFSDAVPNGQLSFKGEITFKSDGESLENKFKDKVVKFIIEYNGKEKYWEVSKKQFDILKTIATKKKENKTLIGLKAVLERTGTGRADTRRAIKF